MTQQNQQQLSIAPLKQGKQAEILRVSASAAGDEQRSFLIEADTVLVSVQASVVTGTLKFDVYTEGTAGVEKKIIDFPQLTAPTSELLMRKASATMQKVIVRVVYTGACTFTVYARGIAIGEATFRILGNNNLTMSATTVTTSAAVLVASALVDRAAVIVKNYSLTNTIFIGGALSEATVLNGWPVGPQESFGADIAAGQALYAIADSGTVDCRISQAGG